MDKIMQLADFRPTIGIYKITNTTNDQAYFGQSRHIMSRIANHTDQLTKGTHQNRKLMRDFRLHGLSIFTVEILEECEVESLLDRELYYLCHHDGKSYNHKYPRYYAGLRRIAKGEDFDGKLEVRE